MVLCLSYKQVRRGIESHWIILSFSLISVIGSYFFVKVNQSYFIHSWISYSEVSIFLTTSIFFRMSMDVDEEIRKMMN